MQQVYVDQCLPEMDCLNKGFKHETTHRIHLTQMFWPYIPEESQKKL